MRSSKVVQVVSCHAEGEVGNVITGGVAPPPGETLWEQRRWIAEDDTLRRFLLNEPRGGVFNHFNLLVPSRDPRAQWAFIVMEPVHTPPMSGSNSMCVATVLLDTGLVEMQAPITRFALEAPGGIVEVSAHCKGGKAERIEIRNVPSFVDRLDARIEVEGLGSLPVDTAYGGDSFVIVDAAALGFSLQPEEARELAETGVRITAAANEQLGFHHPDNPDWDFVSFCQFTAAVERDAQGLRGRSTVAIEPGKLDRSPCGTGCSARMAVLHARGEMAVGDTFTGLSVIDSRFDCRIAGVTEVGGRPAISPIIGGRAWITGLHQYLLDPDDPWPQGYRLSDTWPMPPRN